MDVFSNERIGIGDTKDVEDCIEVDRISFSSLQGSCDDDDLYMSVRESPTESMGIQEIHEDLVLSCRLSEERTCIGSVDNLAEVLTQKLDVLYSAEKRENDIEEDFTPSEDHEFYDLLPSLAAYSLPGKVVGKQPFWTERQEYLRRLRQSDADVSQDLEEMNLGIYSADLALCAMEEARWLNDISKDPILSRLVYEIDPDFPLAVRQHDAEYGSAVPSSSVSPDLKDEEKISVEATTVENSLTNVIPCLDKHRPVPVAPNESRVRSSREGVDEIVLKRAPGSSWSFIAATALHKAFSLDPIRDSRVSLWVCDMILHFDKLLSLPSTSRYSSEMMVDGQIVVLRGSSEWAPPRDAWIFTPVKAESNKILLEQQKFLCAGCGIKVDKEYTKRVRFCEYYGKLFCQCCHQGSKSIIPAKILHQWTFAEFSVSDRALHFLNEAKDQPAIHLITLAPELASKIGVVKRVIQMREKLGYMWDFIKMCPVAEETVTDHGNLKTLFTSLERHLLVSTDVFSLSDLTRVHNKDMVTLLEPIVYYGKCHVEGCQTCKAHAFVCSLCSDATDLLFPFQLEKVVRCGGCGSLSHIKCDAKKRRKSSNLSGECPKCVRMKAHRGDVGR